MEKAGIKKSYSEVINKDASKNANVQKYLKEAVKKAEKEIDKIERGIKLILNNE